MRLNGKAAIMAHLGRAETNRRAWIAILHAYAHVIYTRSPNGKRNRGYWALSEEIDAWDKERCPTVMEVGMQTVEQAESAWRERTSVASAMLKERKEKAKELVAV